MIDQNFAAVSKGKHGRRFLAPLFPPATAAAAAEVEVVTQPSTDLGGETDHDSTWSYQQAPSWDALDDAVEMEYAEAEASTPKSDAADIQQDEEVLETWKESEE